MPTPIERFTALIQTARQSGDQLGYEAVTTALHELDSRGHTDAEISAAQDLLESKAPMDAGAREALENFVNRHALPDPKDAKQHALAAQIESMTAGERVMASQAKKTVALLQEDGATKDERWTAYGWLESLDMTPAARRALEAFVFQPETPLQPMDEAHLREHLTWVLNNFHEGQTLTKNWRSWGNLWEARPKLDLTKTYTTRMELGEEIAEQGWSYAIIVSSWDERPSLPSENRRDHVWFERRNKETGEKQYLADSPHSHFVSTPFRYQEEQALKPYTKSGRSLRLGKERWEQVMKEAFPTQVNQWERRSVHKVVAQRDGNFRVTLQREVPGADLRKIDPKLRMLADRHGYTLDPTGSRERVTMLLSPFGIPLPE